METNFQSQEQPQDHDLSQQVDSFQKELTIAQQRRADLEAQLSVANTALGQLQQENQLLTAGGLDEARQQYETRAKDLEQGFLRREFNRELDQSGFSPDPDHRDFLWHRASQRLAFKGDEPVVIDAQGQLEYTAGNAGVRPMGIPDLITQFRSSESTKIFFTGSSNAGPVVEDGARWITTQQANDRAFLRKEGIDLDDYQSGRVKILPPGQSAPTSASAKPASTTTVPTQPQGQQQVPQISQATLHDLSQLRQWCNVNSVPLDQFNKMVSAGKIQVV
ncbi:hypothetical protein H6F90_12330 [Trichocoleus sp. FACHB-591]|uniref:hypothetical protein n=1 Tax=Trichocoleus sp. FACHB-591 TaxID=2692872 RepID=UPI00168270E1|nr:hypothetical protein [Trichocoleus sp. FACHB-591]MBD2095935.1 hypothetical protein [Trichocoleus sp. FACHB-591]